MPLEEFTYWCAYYNLDAYESSLAEEEMSQKAFFDQALLGAKPK